MTFFSMSYVFCQGLIITPKGNYSCVYADSSTFTGTLNSLCNNTKDTNLFPFPWCKLSKIDFIGFCSKGEIYYYFFEFSFEPDLNTIQKPYLQGEFCHPLKANINYEFGFNIERLNLKKLHSARLFVHFSDSILDINDLCRIENSIEFINLNKVFKHDLLTSVKFNFISHGNEKYFQIWITMPKNSIKHFFLKDWYITSSNDSNCEQNINIGLFSDSANDLKTDTISIINSVLFDFDGYNINNTGLEFMQEIVDIYLLNKKIKNIKIIGHTDTLGNKEYNINLSLKRANSVKEFLLKQGINCESWEIIGLGEESPLYLEFNEQFKNRRVQIIVTYSKT